jgi:phosphodiesterase/alkaline phosphatase D-like protein
VVTWATDEPADSQVDYGPTTAYGSQTALDTTLTASHSQQLNGLSPGTLYHFRVRSRDGAGRLSTSGDSTFTTLVSGPPVISQVQAGSVTGTGALITWSTDTPSDSQVAYGTSSSYGSSTTLDSTLVTSHGQQLSGLSPATQYHFQVKSRDTYANASASADYTLTTAGTAPVISNVQANAVTAGNATIQWTTDVPANSQVEYGTTAGYGSSTTLDAALVTSHSQTLSGLSPNTAYHYRVRSSASSSGAVSGDFTFTTSGAAPSFRARATTTNGFTVSKPAGVASGDLMLASLEVDADPATVTGPAGWTLLLDTRAGAGTPSAFHSQVWYRLAGSSEPASYTWSVSGSPYTDIAVLAYTSVSPTAPVDAAAGRDAGSTSSPTTPNVTTSFSNEMLVALFIDWDYGTWTAGSAMTKRYDFDSLTAQDAASALPGSVPPKTATSTASGPTTAQIVTLRGR